MKLRAALTAAIVVPSAVAITGRSPRRTPPRRLPGPAGHDRGLHGDHHRDRGQRRHRLPGTDHRHHGPGRQRPDLRRRRRRVTPARATTRSSPPARPAPSPPSFLFGGNDSYVSGPGTSAVIVDEMLVVPRHLRAAAGPWSCSRPRRPAPAPSTSVRRAATSTPSGCTGQGRPVRPDGQHRRSPPVTTIGLRNATATGCKVRMKGNAKKNVLDAYGHDIVSSGGGGRDNCCVGSATASTSTCPSAGATSRCSAARPAPTVSPAGSATTC